MTVKDRARGDTIPAEYDGVEAAHEGVVCTSYVYTECSDVPLLCTREQGHEGKHVAHAASGAVGVWDDEDAEGGE